MGHQVGLEDAAVHALDEDAEADVDKDLVDSAEESGPSPPQSGPQSSQISYHWVSWYWVSWRWKRSRTR